MGDLISRSELIKRIKGFTNISSEYFENPELLLDVIENQPTAYNVEKVVAELEKASVGAFDIQTISFRRAVDIVRKGGINERT